jgi:hypothetical protein
MTVNLQVITRYKPCSISAARLVKAAAAAGRARGGGAAARHAAWALPASAGDRAAAPHIHTGKAVLCGLTHLLQQPPCAAVAATVVPTPALPPPTGCEAAIQRRVHIAAHACELFLYCCGDGDGC